MLAPQPAPLCAPPPRRAVFRGQALGGTADSRNGIPFLLFRPTHPRVAGLAGFSPTQRVRPRMPVCPLRVRNAATGHGGHGCSGSCKSRGTAARLGSCPVLIRARSAAPASKVTAAGAERNLVASMATLRDVGCARPGQRPAHRRRPAPRAPGQNQRPAAHALWTSLDEALGASPISVRLAAPPQHHGGARLWRLSSRGRLGVCRPGDKSSRGRLG